MRPHLAPHTRQNSAFFWEMNFSSVQIRLHWVPYSVMFCPRCVLDLHAPDKRAPFPHTIGYYKPAYALHYGLSSERLPLLAGWKGSSLVRTGVPLHSLTSSLKLHVVACDHLSAHYPPQSGTPDPTRTFTRIRVGSRPFLGPRLHALGGRKLTPSNPSTVG
jgi:hypothetical protein